MSGNLIFMAGPRALAMIRDGGLTPDQVDVMAGAAGGPKWLVLSHLDRAIFGSWLKERRPRPLPLVGASIGSWRFAAVSQADPLAAISSFEAEYIHQAYTPRPTPVEITAESMRIQEAYVPDAALDRVINHPCHRLHFLVVRCRGPLAFEGKLIQVIGLGVAAGLNMITRRSQRLLFQRTVFHDPRQAGSLIIPNGFPTRLVPLTKSNFRQALMASGSIPMVMARVRDIPGAPTGTYRDGGILDYHLDLAYNLNSGLVLYPHFSNRITPGWFDKKLTWRLPRYLDRTLVVAPSPDFIQSLPLGKIPDRDDFQLFLGRDRERIAYWKQVVQACAYLGREFLDVAGSGRIRRVVRPLLE
ncbi:MAG: patatin-like phospholipase family protein [Deltaproteobacteria bacterium]|nr:patatin-like phospholipase family protein [Deltaproteobacteria bacterium]